MIAHWSKYSDSPVCLYMLHTFLGPHRVHQQKKLGLKGSDLVCMSLMRFMVSVKRAVLGSIIAEGCTAAIYQSSFSVSWHALCSERVLDW
jgi:hypothetical protein